MQVRRIRLTIEYDPDWGEIRHSQIPVLIAQEREQWIAGDVSVYDILQVEDGSSLFTIEVVP